MCREGKEEVVFSREGDVGGGGEKVPKINIQFPYYLRQTRSS